MCRNLDLDFFNTQLSSCLSSWLSEVYNLTASITLHFLLLSYFVYFYPFFLIISFNSEQHFHSLKTDIYCEKLPFSPTFLHQFTTVVDSELFQEIIELSPHSKWVNFWKASKYCIQWEANGSKKKKILKATLCICFVKEINQYIPS